MKILKVLSAGSWCQAPSENSFVMSWRNTIVDCANDKAVFDLTEYSQIWLDTNSSNCRKDIVSNRRSSYKEIQEKYETIRIIILYPI